MKTFKRVIIICLVSHSIASTIKQLQRGVLLEEMFFAMVFFIVPSIIVTIMICSWAIMVYLRIMQKNIRNYLLLLAFSSLLWTIIRNMKWGPFVFLDVEGRHLWYVFYLFMILIPQLGLLLALAINKKNSFKLDPRWNLLFVPSVLLFLLVMTNDLHQFVFKFNEGFRDWNTDYSYGIGYWIVLCYILLIIVSTTLILIMSWRKGNRNKKSFLPLVVIGVAVLYTIGYILRVQILLFTIDLTTFACLIFIAFWESYIQIGIIPSNSNHKTFFEKTNLSAQGINKDGEVEILSLDTEPISKEEFLKLKTLGNLLEKDKKIFEMSKIDCGFAVWGKDISQLSLMNKNLQELNQKLIGEVELLEKEEQLKEEQVRVEKSNRIYGLITKEVIPSMNKIGTRVKVSKEMEGSKKDKILKEIKVVSSYVKRKTNLILIDENKEQISNGDMLNSFNESFKSLDLLGSYCGINYNFSSNTSNKIHIICYDLFQEIIESINFDFEEIYITGFEDEKNLRFSISMSKRRLISNIDLQWFEVEKLKPFEAVINIEEEEETQNIILRFPKIEEVM